MELVVKNPSGGAGFYVLPWAGLPDICSPTPHDRRLWELVSAEPMPSPASIGRAAGQVVQEGLADLAAQASWSAVETGRYGDRVRANFMLLMLTIRQNETPAEAVMPPEQDHPEQLERRAKRALARVGACSASLPMPWPAISKSWWLCCRISAYPATTNPPSSGAR